MYKTNMPQSWKLDKDIEPANAFSALLYRICRRITHHVEALERELLPHAGPRPPGHEPRAPQTRMPAAQVTTFIEGALRDGPLTLAMLYRCVQQQGYHGDMKQFRAHVNYVTKQPDAPVRWVGRGVYALREGGKHGQ